MNLSGTLSQQLGSLSHMKILDFMWNGITGTIYTQGDWEYQVLGTPVSPNHKLVAFAEDTKGDEIYTVYVMDAETRAMVGQPLAGTTSYLEWAGDDALVYITIDEILRR